MRLRNLVFQRLNTGKSLGIFTYFRKLPTKSFFSQFQEQKLYLFPCRSRKKKDLECVSTVPPLSTGSCHERRGSRRSPAPCGAAGPARAPSAAGPACCSAPTRPRSGTRRCRLPPGPAERCSLGRHIPDVMFPTVALMLISHTSR